MNLFTVEQLELIRRLRTTGITGQEVVEVNKLKIDFPSNISWKNTRTSDSYSF